MSKDGLSAHVSDFLPGDIPGRDQWARAVLKYPWPLEAQQVTILEREGIYAALDSSGNPVIVEGNNRFARLYQFLDPRTTVSFHLASNLSPDEVDNQRRKPVEAGVLNFDDFLTAVALGMVEVRE